MAKPKTDSKPRAKPKDWRAEAKRAEAVNAGLQSAKSRLQADAMDQRERLEGLQREISRLNRDRKAAGDMLDELEPMLDNLAVAPETTFVKDETLVLGRDVVLGKIMAAVQAIPRPMPF